MIFPSNLFAINPIIFFPLGNGLIHNLKFKKSFCWMLVWFSYQITSSFFVVTSLVYLMSSHISHSFPKNYYSSTWKNLFQNHFSLLFRSVFISIYGLNQVFWLNLINLCTFSILTHGLILVLNFLCVQNISFYHVN